MYHIAGTQLDTHAHTHTRTRTHTTQPDTPHTQTHTTHTDGHGHMVVGPAPSGCYRMLLLLRDGRWTLMDKIQHPRNSSKVPASRSSSSTKGAPQLLLLELLLQSWVRAVDAHKGRRFNTRLTATQLRVLVRARSCTDHGKRPSAPWENISVVRNTT